jgi:hypothetical protein
MEGSEHGKLEKTAGKRAQVIVAERAKIKENVDSKGAPGVI